MSHTIYGELRKDTYINQAGTMYSIELSEMNKDKEGNKTYTNYKLHHFSLNHQLPLLIIMSD